MYPGNSSWEAYASLDSRSPIIPALFNAWGTPYLEGQGDLVSRLINPDRINHD